MSRLRSIVGAWPVVIAVLGISPATAQEREIKVRKDRTDVETKGDWIYNDLPRGVREAKQSGKPLLVVFRCIPCEACAQLDEQVVERDPSVRSLLDKFVLVRIVHANGLDLSLFQYDYDQSWAAFFLNADLTIYGRYGTRSHRTESHNDVTLAGFGKALEGALAIHADYPKNKESLAAKHGPPSDVKTPEEFASLKGKYDSTLDYEGKVVQSCIHCHQVGEALRRVYRDAKKPIPDDVLYPYPNPKALGLVLDPQEKARVKSVTPNSPAERDGFQAGDELTTLEGQPLLSIADVQWVLHRAGETGSLRADVARGSKTIPLTLTLAKGWRQLDDITWRATSWDLRRMVTGGLVFEELPAEDRQKAKLADTALALRVRHVGQYGAHAAAKQAGFKQGDVLIAIDGQTDRLTEGDLLASLAKRTKPGDRLPVTVLRGGEKLELKLPMQ